MSQQWPGYDANSSRAGNDPYAAQRQGYVPTGYEPTGYEPTDPADHDRSRQDPAAGWGRTDPGFDPSTAGFDSARPDHQGYGQTAYGSNPADPYGYGQAAKHGYGHDGSAVAPYAAAPYPHPGQLGGVSPRSKIAAALLAFFLGGFGVHNFYLGYTGRGIAQLLITVLSVGFLAPITAIWALVEFILILTGGLTDVEGRPLSS